MKRDIVEQIPRPQSEMSSVRPAVNYLTQYDIKFEMEGRRSVWLPTTQGEQGWLLRTLYCEATTTPKKQFCNPRSLTHLFVTLANMQLGTRQTWVDGDSLTPSFSCAGRLGAGSLSG